MIVTRHIEVPTGNIVVCKCDNGRELEFVSVGDYGKDTNIKADFLGLTREPEQFTHGELMPLEDKWVITVSTQHGCSMGCSFCDVPKVGQGINVSCGDLLGQIDIGLMLHNEVKQSKRLNIHFARMGEPTWNESVLTCAEIAYERYNADFNIHPVVSTMMPENNCNLADFIGQWVEIKNSLYRGNASLQLSINSTCEAERAKMFNGNASSLERISEIMKKYKPVGRKFTLNFAVADYIIDADILLKYFNPEHFIVKLTPMHKTSTAENNDIVTDGKFTEYHPYIKHEEALKAAGYDVIVFLASEYEDMGRITCGNAILSGSMPEVPHKVII